MFMVLWTLLKWEDDFLKYIIDQKVECISDVDWNNVLKEKPFLTKTQISVLLANARNKVKDRIQGPLYEQIAAFRNKIPTGRSSPKWIEEYKLEVNQIYDAMMQAKFAKFE